MSYNKLQMADKKKKKKVEKHKDPFSVRMKRRGREFMNLGRTLAKEPGKFPHALLDFFRRSFRTVWDARGGGLYACGYVVTLVWLEIAMFVDDILAADSMSGFLGAQLFEMLFRYLGESFVNMIAAFMWPVYIVTFAPPWGAVAFGFAYLGFDKLFREPIEGWLFHDEEVPVEPDTISTNTQEEN